MTVIDVEIRALVQRSIYSPAYGRRTDRDRRPARIVARPNDGPGCMEARERLAQEIAQSRARKSITIPGKPMSSEERSRAHRQAFSVAMLQQVAAAPMGMLLRDCANAVLCGQDMAGRLSAEMADAGWITRERSARPGGGLVVKLIITDAGRAYLAGLGQ